MDNEAIQIVREYIIDHLDKGDPTPDFHIYVAWKAKVLQNWKYMLSSTLLDGMYYELTFDGDHKAWYFTAFKAFECKTIYKPFVD